MPGADTWELIALSDFNTRLLRTGRGRRRRLAHIPSDAVSTAIGWADVVDGTPLDDYYHSVVKNPVQWFIE